MSLSTRFGKLEEYEIKLGRKKGVSTLSQNFTCFECGKQGHIKAECPNIIKKNALKKKEFKKAYKAREDNEVNSSSELENDECANVSLMASHQSDEEEEVCKKSTSSMWYFDSGCSKHMTGDKTKFSTLTLESKGYVIYRENNNGKILGIVKVGAALSPSIEDVLYVEGLNHNLNSISQLCDKCYKIAFNKDK
uniref:Uncharacterized protein LOC113788224 n=1 Tax=Cicer arietinum TaxID=3827 RepID=A0A3Q7XIE0_CICAR|nr:uncharacterized protein LOC113788224 [Cicer arietinum]